MAVTKNKYNARGIIPDHEIAPAMAAILLGRDTQLEYTFELIRHKR